MLYSIRAERSVAKSKHFMKKHLPFDYTPYGRSAQGGEND